MGLAPAPAAKRAEIAAPAKINLHLSVAGARPDGFHEIESLFLALDFGDRLFLETLPPGSRPQVETRSGSGFDPAEMPEETENIVYKAAELFALACPAAPGFKIAIEKRVPIGGGLGGGSSDAAAALLAMNRLAKPGGLLPPEELAEIGARLGSDLPFFLSGASAAWVSGRGEIVAPEELPAGMRGLTFLLATPGFQSGTARAFALLDESRALSPPSARRINASEAMRALREPPELWPFFNDFLPALDRSGEYGRIIGALKENGAVFAGLSGSGSTCFGVFELREAASRAKNALSDGIFRLLNIASCVDGRSVI